MCDLFVNFVYAMCVFRSYMAGDVTLILINIQTEKPATIQLVEPLSQFNVDVYLLTPGIGGITSKYGVY